MEWIRIRVTYKRNLSLFWSFCEVVTERKGNFRTLLFSFIMSQKFWRLLNIFYTQIKMPIVKYLSQPRITAMFLEHSSLYVRSFEILLFSLGRLYSSHERILWKPLQSQVQNTPGISVILISYFSENVLSSVVEQSWKPVS